MSKLSDLKTCPFCGGPAEIEEVEGALGATFTVGCNDSAGEAECMGYQSLTTFARRSDAIEAWNRRANGWQPFETAPKDGRWLIAACNDHSALFRISWGRSRAGDLCWCSVDGRHYGDGLFAPNGCWIESPLFASAQSAGDSK